MSLHPASVAESNVKFNNNPFSLLGRNMRGVSFIAASSGIGQKKIGVHQGPMHVLSDAFVHSLRATWKEVEVAEAKEVRMQSLWDPAVQPKSVMSSPHHPMSVRATCEAVRVLVERAIYRNFFPCMVGGDHCLAMGSIAAVAKRFPDLCVIWVDAHADVNTPYTSGSGNMHGMPVAALLGLDGMTVAPGFESHPFKCLTPDRVGYIGLRDVDEGETAIMKQLGISDSAFTADDVKRDGIRSIIERVIDRINPRRNRPIHLSFDVDGVDPLYMPSTGTTVHKGLSMEDALQIFRAVKHSGLLVGCDLVEVNPHLGNQEAVEVTVANSQLLLRELLQPELQNAKAALAMPPQQPKQKKLQSKL